MTVIDRRPPRLDRFTRLIENCWAHHGPCAHLHITSAFDTERRAWLIVAAPVIQEVMGGEDDGKKVWTGYVHAEKRLRAMTEVRISAGSYCVNCNPVPKAIIQGRYRLQL